MGSNYIKLPPWLRAVLKITTSHFTLKVTKCRVPQSLLVSVVSHNATNGRTAFRNHRIQSRLSLVTILSGCEINNFGGQPASGSAITWLPCLTCFGSGSEPCFAGFGRTAV